MKIIYNFIMSGNINCYNNYPINNNININLENNMKYNYLNNIHKLSNRQPKNSNRINLINNRINANNNNIYDKSSIHYNKKIGIFVPKFYKTDKNESLGNLSKIADDLYNYRLKQKKEKKIHIQNNFNNFENININQEDEKEIFNDNMIETQFINNLGENLLGNTKSFINSNNNITNMDKKKPYYMNYNKLEKIDFREDIIQNILIIFN